MNTTEYSVAERREMARAAESERRDIERDRKDRWFYGVLFGGFTAYMILLIWFTQLS